MYHLETEVLGGSSSSNRRREAAQAAWKKRGFGLLQAWLLKRKTGDISMSSPILPRRFHFAGALHGNPLIYMLCMLPGRSHLVGALPGNPHSTCYSCYLDLFTLPTPVFCAPRPPLPRASISHA